MVTEEGVKEEMRTLVLGIGKIGSALLGDLIRSDEVSKIVAGDIARARAKLV